jgi:predicted  nucleic acid-binding Zn-ribbon protein
MGELRKNLLSDLLQLSKSDSALAAVLAEKKGLEKSLLEKTENLKKADMVVQAKLKVFEDKRSLTRMEEKSISDERHRLNERRRALKTLSTFKLQQAAEKEVDYGQRQTAIREEALLKALGEAEDLETDLKAAQGQFAALKGDLEKTEEEAKGTLVTLAERHQRHAEERAELAKGIEPSVLSTYNRIKDKHAMNAVVPVEKGICVGCFMQVGPQIIVQISRANALVRCPGCGRILFLAEEPKADAAAQSK